MTVVIHDYAATDRLHNMGATRQAEKSSATRLSKATKQPRRQPEEPGAAFDPEDLSRRLNNVIAQRRARSERKRAEALVEESAPAEPTSNPSQSQQERYGLAVPKHIEPSSGGAKRSSSTGPERDASRNDPRRSKSNKNRPNHKLSSGESLITSKVYVPRVAATQFELTATATAPAQRTSSSTHKLSRKAVQYHLQGPTATAPVDAHTTVADSAKAIRASQAQREKVLDRNQFQRDKTLERAAETDKERFVTSQQRQSFIAHFVEGGQSADHANAAANRLSRADFALDRADVFDLINGPAEEPQVPPHGVNEHRVDWTQSDESGGRKPLAVGTKGHRRRPESLWVRLGTFAKQGREEPTTEAPRDTLTPPETPRSPKSPVVDFFARLKVGS